MYSVEAMTESCDLIVSVCPPSAALDVARQVAAVGFGGTYLDANAIAPATAREVAAVLEEAGGRYVDGGIIGPPPSPSSSPRLYLSGPSAPPVRDLFAGTAVQAHVISEDQSAASALKMCFAAWTKGTAALLLDVRALALAEGVEGPLLAEWEHSLPDLAGRSLPGGPAGGDQGLALGGRDGPDRGDLSLRRAAGRLPPGGGGGLRQARPRRGGRGGRGHPGQRAPRPVGGTRAGLSHTHPASCQPISSFARPRTKRSAESARSTAPALGLEELVGPEHLQDAA